MLLDGGCHLTLVEVYIYNIIFVGTGTLIPQKIFLGLRIYHSFMVIKSEKGVTISTILVSFTALFFWPKYRSEAKLHLG
jgi:hypothetical protein